MDCVRWCVYDDGNDGNVHDGPSLAFIVLIRRDPFLLLRTSLTPGGNITPLPSLSLSLSLSLCHFLLFDRECSNELINQRTKLKKKKKRDIRGRIAFN